MSWGEIAALEEFRVLRVNAEGMRRLYNRAKQRQAEQEQVSREGCLGHGSRSAAHWPVMAVKYTATAITGDVTDVHACHFRSMPSRGCWLYAACMYPPGNHVWHLPMVVQGGVTCILPSALFRCLQAEMYRAGLVQAPGAVPGFYNPANPAMAAAAALGMRPGLPQPGAMLHVPPPAAATATLSGDSGLSGRGRSRSPGWEPGSKRGASAGPARANKRPVGRPRKVVTLPALPEPYGGWEQFINRQAYHRCGSGVLSRVLLWGVGVHV